jgi:hypothetical protein
MIDLLAITISCFMVLLIVRRAIKFDSRLPWYGVPAKKPAEIRAGSRRRRGGGAAAEAPGGAPVTPRQS